MEACKIGGVHRAVMIGSKFADRPETAGGVVRFDQPRVINLVARHARIPADPIMEEVLVQFAGSPRRAIKRESPLHF